MNIILLILGDIIVENYFHVIYIYAPCGNICCNKNLYRSIPETIHYSVSLRLFKVTVQTIRKIPSALKFLDYLVYTSLGITKHKRQIRIVYIYQPCQQLEFVSFLNLNI